MTTSDDFEQIVEEILEKRGLALPRLPDSPGRSAYLDYLSSVGYGEDELLPIVDTSQVTGVMRGAVLAGLMDAISSNDDSLLKFMAFLAINALSGRHNTNLLIHELAEDLVRTMPPGVEVQQFYAGVLPTNSYGAQAKFHAGELLVLIDTGAMEMADAVTTLFLAKTPRAQRADEIGDLVDEYIDAFRRADPLSVTATGVDWGSGFGAVLTNAVERFILAHEMAHLALKHVHERGERRLRTPVGALIVEEHTVFEEFQADAWASKVLIESARLSHQRDQAVPIAIGGIAIALNINLLVEGASINACVTYDDGHPSATERLYQADVLFEALDVFDDAYISRRFQELMSDLVPKRYPGVELPPLLDRDINRKVIPVLESIGISYDTDWT